VKRLDEPSIREMLGIYYVQGAEVTNDQCIDADDAFRIFAL
jgi:hypothetical protein